MSLIVLLLLLVRPPAPAVPIAASHTSATTTTAAAGTTPAAASRDDAVPVPAPTAKALRYYRSGNALYLVALLWSLLVPALFFFSGAAARLRSWCERVGRRWFFSLALFTTVSLLASWLLDLPLAWYAGFVRQHAYGVSNQTAAKWIHDSVVAMLFDLVTTPLIVAIPLALARRKPRSWWIYTAALTAPLIAFVILVTPVIFDPLFNHFTPMKDRLLEQKIVSLAHRAGVDGADIFEVDKSRDTTMVNAYVTGFMQTKRIVVWDTSIRKLEQRELLFVVGHELGHYVLHHVAQFVWVGALAALVSLFLLHVSGNWILSATSARSGVSSAGDLAVLPLALFLGTLISIAIAPPLLALSRHNEHEADRFALELTHDNHAGASSFAKMVDDNLSLPRPGPLYRFFRASHPSLGERVDFCNRYRPWSDGEPLRYAPLLAPRIP